MVQAALKIRQFSRCQYDYRNGAFACTAIALVAASEFLRKRGHAKKCLWTDEKVAAIISLGVEFYNAWAHEHAGGDRQALAAADEIAQLPSLSALLSVQDCVFGQYSSDAIGLTLAQAVEQMQRDTSPESNKAGVSAYVFTTQAHSTFIGVRRTATYDSVDEPYQYRFVVFDSHTRDKTTGLYIKSGKAVTVRLASAQLLSAYLARLYDVRTKPHELFTLHKIKTGDRRPTRPLLSASASEALLNNKAGNASLLSASLSSSLSASAGESGADSADSSSPTTTPPISRLARQFSRLATLARRTSVPGY